MRSATFTSLVFAFWLISNLVSCQNSSSITNETFEGEVEHSYFLLNSAFGILQNKLAAQALDLPVGTCNDQTPCVNGACCSKVGHYYLMGRYQTLTWNRSPDYAATLPQSAEPETARLTAMRKQSVVSMASLTSGSVRLESVARNSGTCDL